MKLLEYPFDAERILREKKKLRRELLSSDGPFLDIKIAILGGFTTNDVRLILELFLLHHGIRPSFYESEYNRYYEDAVFGNDEFNAFQPDLVYLCTCSRNIQRYPEASDSPADVEEKLEAAFQRLSAVWSAIQERFGCVIIQNNFELPSSRLLGNRDAADHRGRVLFLSKLNLKLAEYAQTHESFYLNDYNYLAAQYGLDRWQDPFYWYMYKYALAVPAIPFLAFSVSNIIKAIYGKNKKALALDLDNTIWGGVVGDDGVENLKIGQETAEGEAYLDFQDYLKQLSKIGVLLNVNSKNDVCCALDGLAHPEGILKQEDFIVVKANWEPKSQNLAEIAQRLNIAADSIVFVDDNPAERENVRQAFPTVSAPELGQDPGLYLRILDHSGFFECVGLSQEDLNKSAMYRQNAQREAIRQDFADYDAYLRSLRMRAEIRPFIPLYLARIAQLTNKSNQFNLTTKRYSQAEIEAVAGSGEYLTLYGKLTDRFGDNGVVSVVIGHLRDPQTLDIDLWIMSCRVLKRGMEDAMTDELVLRCRQTGVQTIYGYYYPTKKNGMVRDFYQRQGYSKLSEDESGNTVWKLDVSHYEPHGRWIEINRTEE